MLHELLRAFAIVLVIEGILPFLSPAGWKRFAAQMLGVPNNAMRVAGLGMMLVGVFLLYLVS